MRNKERTENLLLQISQLQRRFEFVERTAKVGYWELDLRAKKFYWSKEVYRIFGVKSDRGYQHHNLIKDRILPEDMPVYKQKIRVLLRDEEPVEGVIRLKKKDGSLIDCLFRADRLIENSISRIIGIFQDITDIRQNQINLLAENDKIKKDIVVRDWFIAQATHDLRQPLHAIRLFADALDIEELTNEQAQTVCKIKNSISRLAVLLDDFLDVSKLNYGGLVAQYSCFNLSNLVDNICHEYQNFCCIKMVCSNKVSSVYGDEILIERVLRNLLNNAFKYAKTKVVLKVGYENNKLKMRIIDDGKGISKGEQDKVFNDFYKINKQDEGSGLGLGIVMRIIKILDGSIKIRSKYGYYCAFEISLPLALC